MQVWLASVCTPFRHGRLVDTKLFRQPQVGLSNLGQYRFYTIDFLLHMLTNCLCMQIYVFHRKSASLAVICHRDKWNIFTSILSGSRDFTLQRLIHALHSCQGTPCLMKTIFLSLSSGKRIDCIILVRNSRKSFVAEKSHTRKKVNPTQ